MISTPTYFTLLTALLAQSDGQAWWKFLVEQAFGLTILFIFLVAIVSVLVNQWRRDKCLKLLDGFHATYLNKQGKAQWGDLIVFSKGIELTYDAAYRTQRGIIKTSSLIYPEQLGEALAFCRSVHALTEKESKRRKRQIRRSFQPGLIRRSLRWFQNMVNTFRDAFSKSISAIIGQLSKRIGSPSLAQQSTGVEQIGQTLIGAAGNAYEPLLERHIGQPVVLQLKTPAAGENQSIDIPGYLVDYSDKWVALFNVEHEAVRDETHQITGPIESPEYKIEPMGSVIRVSCTGSDLVIIKGMDTDGRNAALDVVLVKGASLDLRHDCEQGCTLHLQITRRVDIVCPRSLGTVYFGGSLEAAALQEDKRPGEGLAPEADVQAKSDSPIEISQ